MARIRTIKPEFFTSDDIVSMTPLARLFYVSLWCEADREGRLPWNVRTLKMRYLPGDDCSIEDLAAELIDGELIFVYQVDGKSYAEIPSFKHHQVINNRESESVIPPRVCDAPSTRESAVQAEGKEGREGKGREVASKRRASPKTSIPDDFDVSERVRQWAAKNGHSRLDERADHFRLTATAKGYTYSDWDSAFMKAVTDDWAKLGGKGPESQPGGGRRAL